MILLSMKYLDRIISKAPRRSEKPHPEFLPEPLHLPVHEPRDRRDEQPSVEKPYQGPGSHVVVIDIS